jgi:hypothetical protein
MPGKQGKQEKLVKLKEKDSVLTSRVAPYCQLSGERLSGASLAQARVRSQAASLRVFVLETRNLSPVLLTRAHLLRRLACRKNLPQPACSHFTGGSSPNCLSRLYMLLFVAQIRGYALKAHVYAAACSFLRSRLVQAFL